MTFDWYDVVVVPAGSAGRVLAGLLSADPSLRVPLLQAGPPAVRAAPALPGGDR